MQKLQHACKVPQLCQKVKQVQYHSSVRKSNKCNTTALSESKQVQGGRGLGRKKEEEKTRTAHKVLPQSAAISKALIILTLVMTSLSKSCLHAKLLFPTENESVDSVLRYTGDRW